MQFYFYKESNEGWSWWFLFFCVFFGICWTSSCWVLSSPFKLLHNWGCEKLVNRICVQHIAYFGVWIHQIPCQESSEYSMLWDIMVGGVNPRVSRSLKSKQGSLHYWMFRNMTIGRENPKAPEPEHCGGQGHFLLQHRFLSKSSTILFTIFCSSLIFLSTCFSTIPS